MLKGLFQALLWVGYVGERGAAAWHAAAFRESGALQRGTPECLTTLQRGTPMLMERARHA